MTRQNIDSLKLLMFVPKGSLVGDSLAPMGLEVYRLNKQLTAPIFSNFNLKTIIIPLINSERKSMYAMLWGLQTQSKR